MFTSSLHTCFKREGNYWLDLWPIPEWLPWKWHLLLEHAAYLHIIRLLLALLLILYFVLRTKLLPVKVKPQVWCVLMSFVVLCYFWTLLAGAWSHGDLWQSCSAEILFRHGSHPPPVEEINLLSAKSPFGEIRGVGRTPALLSELAFTSCPCLRTRSNIHSSVSVS